MSDTRNHTTRDQMARIAETVIGLGVDPVPGCNLCGRRHRICPTHTGAAIADALLASDAIAAVRAAAEAETTAAIEAAFDPGELDCGRVGMPCLDVHPADRWCRPCRIRAALSGGRTAHDTTLTQARADALREAAADWDALLPDADTPGAFARWLLTRADTGADQ